jgi:murein DD-endopeptidase MepM/ murein hydrolase activator NlpD
VVKHADGTYASYAHLSPFSARVKPGQRVSGGTPLATSGETGFTSGPHLHFDVYRPVVGGFRETIAVAFGTRDGIVRQVAAGEDYCRQ